MAPSRQQVAEAMDFLVQHRKFVSLQRELVSMVDSWDEHPTIYAGQLVLLNALIDVGVTQRKVFDRLMEIATDKHKEVPDTKVTEYQRGYMAERRSREYKALELFQLTKGIITSADKRKQYIASMRERWAKERKRFIASKGKLSWAARNSASNEFWGHIDQQLDASLAAARKKNPAGVEKIRLQRKLSKKAAAT